LDTASLIGLYGLVGLKKFTFMLDSGASSNFISESIAAELGLRFKSLASRTVRLADGKLISTVG
jgi:predicted aspartyl protease